MKTSQIENVNEQNAGQESEQFDLLDDKFTVEIPKEIKGGGFSWGVRACGGIDGSG